MQQLRIFAIAAATALFATAGHAAIFIGSFSGAAENPPSGSPGTGSITAVVDETAHTLAIDADFENLLEVTTAAHLHCCAPPSGNAGVAVQAPSLAGFPLGVQSGSYFHVFDLTDPNTYGADFLSDSGGDVSAAEAALIAALFAGEVYANIHTELFPAGEIRANLSEIPLPAAAWLFAAGVLTFVWRGRRKTTAI